MSESRSVPTRSMSRAIVPTDMPMRTGSRPKPSMRFDARTSWLRPETTPPPTLRRQDFSHSAVMRQHPPRKRPSCDTMSGSSGVSQALAAALRRDTSAGCACLRDQRTSRPNPINQIVARAIPDGSANGMGLSATIATTTAHHRSTRPRNMQENIRSFRLLVIGAVDNQA